MQYKILHTAYMCLIARRFVIIAILLVVNTTSVYAQMFSNPDNLGLP